jgi:hypothetical protein
MDHQVIITSNERSVEFAGAIVAESQRGNDKREPNGLTFHLQIWETDERAFVTVIYGFVDDEPRPRFIEAELVESVTDVENFFFVFEPGEIVTKLKSASDNWNAPLDVVQESYERQVHKMLMEFGTSAAGAASQHIDSDSSHPRASIG